MLENHYNNLVNNIVWLFRYVINHPSAKSITFVYEIQVNFLNDGWTCMHIIPHAHHGMLKRSLNNFFVLLTLVSIYSFLGKSKISTENEVDHLLHDELFDSICNICTKVCRGPIYLSSHISTGVSFQNRHIGWQNTW